NELSKNGKMMIHKGQTQIYPKNDLSDICHSLGLSTEKNKVDLVQKLKDYQVKGSRKRNVEKEKFSNDGLQISIDNESVVSDNYTEMM
ncbi:203_t:CDS:2, partial [Racocetra persica]